jgi:hypothetical protein
MKARIVCFSGHSGVVCSGAYFDDPMLRQVMSTVSLQDVGYHDRSLCSFRVVHELSINFLIVVGTYLLDFLFNLLTLQRDMVSLRALGK